MKATVVVSQLGARMHYAVPRIFAADGTLRHFYTDICATKGWPRLLSRFPRQFLPTALRRLAGRNVPPQIPTELITVFPAFGITSALKRLRVKNTSGETSHAIWAGARFSKLVSRNGFHGATGLYAFSGDALEQIQTARHLGMWTAVEQMIAPRGVLEALILEEMQRFPDWEGLARRDPLDTIFAARERAEWHLADRVICPSEFVARNVVAEGGCPEKCLVVPYGVDNTFRCERTRRMPGPLRILVVGAVGLRKGSPYVAEAARQLGRSAVFRMAGSAKLSESVTRNLSESVDLRGIVPRSEIAAEFQWADVFLLPSLCEGSATAIYEALSTGLPVITTENAGSVIRNGLEGLVVPIRDAGAIAEAVTYLADNESARLQMATNAIERAADFTVARYGERLLLALSTLPAERRRPLP
ncbi:MULTISPECIES: glycosyltransferase family 4 protein [unclassified Rhizobium]|uniref:glycosyltransferase family 4 protein n=1 Tax=unclassified Rhizobium TaxID=2613769 RepID=UPI0007138911|nr:MULTISPECIES: glycosyltransferase family 4 protein [unclassified Rhizobium]KQT04779.1 glycoside hydrolase [Rhizobium sp. Leaf386]KQU02131.1 glycoside hydrolase [Rhizobium sp. Leaf453]